jgi:hypothetical protein
MIIIARMLHQSGPSSIIVVCTFVRHAYIIICERYVNEMLSSQKHFIRLRTKKYIHINRVFEFYDIVQIYWNRCKNSRLYTHNHVFLIPLHRVNRPWNIVHIRQQSNVFTNIMFLYKMEVTTRKYKCAYILVLSFIKKLTIFLHFFFYWKKKINKWI